jgi:tetratricopeptide (TPR) repeat protein
MRPLFAALIVLSLISIAYSETVGDCNAHYASREKQGEIDKAIDCYEQVLSADTHNFEAAWKLSKSYWHKGNYGIPSEKAAWFQKGIDAGKEAVSIKPKDCEGHFWLGVNYALLGENSGIFKALGIVDDVKNEMRTAMEIKIDCECGGPQRVLGKLYERLPWFKGGSKSKSIEYLKQSIQICPSDTQSRLFLAETYLDQDRKDLAIEQLNLVLKQEPHPAWIPETKENKIKAGEMLNRLKK